MMGKSELAALSAGVTAVGGRLGTAVSRDEVAVSRVWRHLCEVREWNEKLNLTAITDPVEMIWKHAVDSASCLPWLDLPAGSTVLDVGSGAGFPGLVIKCLVPALHVTLLDAVRKKCTFLEHACRAVGFEPGRDGVRVVWQRAEDAARQTGLREGFDVVVVRAVARLPVLSELCLPFVRRGGHVLAMKGPGVETEMAGLAAALEILGGKVEEVRGLRLPEGAGERSMVILRKVGETPAAYPRRAGLPERRPLGGGSAHQGPVGGPRKR